MPKIHLHWLYPNFHVPPYLGHAMEPGKQHPWLPTCSCAGWYLAGHLLQNAMWRSRFWTANCGDAGAPQPSSAIGLPGAVWGLAPARAWKRRSGHTALARYRLEGSLDRTDPTKAWQTPRRPGRKSTEKKVPCCYGLHNGYKLFKPQLGHLEKTPPWHRFSRVAGLANHDP